MGKKMKLPFLSQSKSLDPNQLSSSSSPSYSLSSPPWPWRACGHIKTLSFRAAADDNHNAAFRTTFNSAFLDTELTPPESFFTISSSSRSFSTMSDDSGDPLESIIHGLRSDRLFFDPQQSSSLVSIDEHEHEDDEKRLSFCEEKIEKEEEEKIEEEDDDEEGMNVGYKESEMLSMESSNPYEDFKRSMEEMVEAHGLKDWQGLEELLGCYLKINGKNNHGYIVGAFIDLLVSLSFITESSSSSSSTSTSTTSTTRTTTMETRTTRTRTRTIVSSSSSSLSSSTNSNSPSSPLSLPSSSSLTTPCLSSILDHGDDDDEHHDDDVDDDDDVHVHVDDDVDDDDDSQLSS